MPDIAVSITCITFNQREYIAQAIESFLMQKTNFKYEILIHDDASTDGTTDILREYEKKNPDIIKVVYQTENQYSQGKKITQTFLYPLCQGKYIAFCEGDDYWTDPYKLQKQYDYMEAHPDCSMCVHAADIVKADTGQRLKTDSIATKLTKFYIEDAIKGLGRLISTNSFFYRSEWGMQQPEFRKIGPCGDYPMPILCASFGYIAYLPDNMAAHRAMANNSLSLAWVKNPEKKYKYNLRYEKMLDAIDEYTDHKYTGLLEAEHTRLWANYFIAIRDKKTLKEDKYKQYLKSRGLKERIKNCLTIYCPASVLFIRKITGMIFDMKYKIGKK